MNKLLTAGLVAAVAMTSANASQGRCGMSGFYAELSAGFAMTKMKYNNNIEQLQSLYQPKVHTITVTATAEDVDGRGEGITPQKDDVYYPKNSLKTVELKNKLQKKKTNFIAELSCGYLYTCGRIEVGLGVNLGKSFEEIKKTTENLVLMYNYFPSDATYVQVKNGSKITYSETEKGDVDATDAGINIDGDNAILKEILQSGDKQLYPKGRKFTISCKNKVYVEFAPTLGLNLSNNVSIYIGAGVKYRSDKYTLQIGDTYDKHKKTISKIIPVIKGGIRIWMNNYYVKLECSHDFKSKKKFTYKDDTTNISPDVKHTLQNSNTSVKLGVGKVF